MSYFYTLVYDLAKHTENTRTTARFLQETTKQLKTVIDTIEDRNMLITLVGIHTRLEQAVKDLFNVADEIDASLKRILLYL